LLMVELTSTDLLSKFKILRKPTRRSLTRSLLRSSLMPRLSNKS
jgi:hypothetical protein